MEVTTPHQVGPLAYCYDLYGLHVGCAVELPARPVATPPQFTFEILPEARRGSPDGSGVIVAEYADSLRAYQVTRTRTGLLCTYPGLCEVELSADLRHAAAYAPTAEARDYAQLLLSSSIPALVLTLQGHFLLHASAVDLGAVDLSTTARETVNLGDTVVAIAGASGSGKSTLAALATAAGATAVSDDCLRITDVDGVFRCHGGPEQFRLRDHAAVLQSLGELRATSTPLDARVGVWGPRPRASRDDESGARLGAVVFPQRTETTNATPRRLSHAEAAARLSAGQRTLGLKDPQLLQHQLRQAARIAGAVPVWELPTNWTEPFTLERAHRVRGMLSDLLGR